MTFTSGRLGRGERAKWGDRMKRERADKRSLPLLGGPRAVGKEPSQHREREIVP